MYELKLISKCIGTFRLGIVRGQMGIIFDFDLYEFCTNFSERFTTCILSRFVRIFLNLNALLRVCYLDLYEFDLYDLFGERFSRTNRGIAVIQFEFLRQNCSRFQDVGGAATILMTLPVVQWYQRYACRVLRRPGRFIFGAKIQRNWHFYY